MDYLPVEVIGNILSRIEAARDVVLASATCRKWREAYRKHLDTLTFDCIDCLAYQDLSTSELEILITRTIFQTTGLHNLSILIDNGVEFSASAVVAWLLYTRDTLRQLFYNVRTAPNINILDVCGRKKLEQLGLAYNYINGVEPKYQRFPCLKSLALSSVGISALDLNLLLTACPKLEFLTLKDLEIAVSDAQATVELSSSTLKSIYVEALCLDKFIVEADNLETLHLKDCALELFELIGKGKLKHFRVDDVSVIHLDISETIENLETVDVSSFTINWTKFYQMISKSMKLRKLRLWDVVLSDEDEIMDVETIATCFPQLRHLALSYDYDIKDGEVHYGSQGSSLLENVIVLELGWIEVNDLFSHWVAGFLKLCPNLKKLVIHGLVSDAQTNEECKMLANFTSSIVQLMRTYAHIEVHFEYE